MYPNEIFLGLDLYGICMCVGVFLCIVAFSVLSDKIKLSVKLQKFSYICALAAIPLGYFSAVLFQAFYNIKRDGGFVINSGTGATFYGGLVGGASVFLVIYFVAGKFVFPDGYHKLHFFRMSATASVSITLAHAFGRLGCLFAGCCHGNETDAWYGIVMGGKKYVPIQLFESIFLFCLCALLVVLLLKKIYFGLPIYMTGYGFWRFIIEYARGDYRGNTLVNFMSPSQLIALLLFVGGIILLVFEIKYLKKHNSEITVEDSNS